MRALTPDEQQALADRQAHFEAFVDEMRPCVVGLAEGVVEAAPDLARAYRYALPDDAAADPTSFLPLLDAWLRDEDVAAAAVDDRVWLSVHLMYVVAYYLQQVHGATLRVEDNPDSPFFADYVAQLPTGAAIDPAIFARNLLAEPPGRGLTDALRQVVQAGQGGPNTSEALLALVSDALSHGVDTVSARPVDRAEDAMHPFVMLHDGEHRRMERFVGATAEGDLAAARAMLAASTAERAALVYDGYAPDERGRKTDAILVEASERDAGHGLAFAQRYAPATRRKPFRTVGAASYLGRVAPLLPSNSSKR